MKRFIAIDSARKRTRALSSRRSEFSKINTARETIKPTTASKTHQHNKSVNNTIQQMTYHAWLERGKGECKEEAWKAMNLLRDREVWDVVVKKTKTKKLKNLQNLGKLGAPILRRQDLWDHVGISSRLCHCWNWRGRRWGRSRDTVQNYWTWSRRLGCLHSHWGSIIILRSSGCLAAFGCVWSLYRKHSSSCR